MMDPVRESADTRRKRLYRERQAEYWAQNEKKLSMWPAVIEKFGERFYFSKERPGWLLYENEEHQILVGRAEAYDLEVEEDT